MQIWYEYSFSIIKKKKITRSKTFHYKKKKEKRIITSKTEFITSSRRFIAYIRALFPRSPNQKTNGEIWRGRHCCTLTFLRRGREEIVGLVFISIVGRSKPVEKVGLQQRVAAIQTHHCERAFRSSGARKTRYWFSKSRNRFARNTCHKRGKNRDACGISWNDDIFHFDPVESLERPISCIPW